MIINYCIYSHYSIGEAFAHPDEIVAKTLEYGHSAVCLTDLHNISGASEFLSEIKSQSKKAGKTLKGIIGATVRVNSGTELYYIILLAQNKAGYTNLVKLLNRSEYVNKMLCVTEAQLKEFKDNLLCITGQQSVERLALLNAIYPAPKVFFDNFTDVRFTNRRITGSPSYYVSPEDRLYQQIVICKRHSITLSQSETIKETDPHGYNFFTDQDFSLKSTAADESSLVLGTLCESYDLAEKPYIPKYLENGKPLTDPDATLTQYCRDGWVNRKLNIKTKNDPVLREVYANRIKMELDVFKRAKIADYLLIVRDIINFTKKNKSQVGLRGSASGCLVSYLSNTNDIDPVLPDPSLPYHPDRELLFSRFFNAGRLSDGHISLADIDIDFCPSFRPKVKAYLKEKYGKEYVADYIISFNKYDGKGAVKEVFRVLESAPVEVVNQITSQMVDKSKISDQLEDLKEDDPKYNTVNYNVEYVGAIAEYYKEYKREFDIAIRLANTISGTGKHAAAIVISPVPVKDYFPILLDPDTGEYILAVEMKSAENIGAVKYDLLSVAAYEKIEKIIEMIDQNLKEPTVGEENIEED